MNASWAAITDCELCKYTGGGNEEMMNILSYMIDSTGAVHEDLAWFVVAYVGLRVCAPLRVGAVLSRPRCAAQARGHGHAPWYRCSWRAPERDERIVRGYTSTWTFCDV